MTDNPPAGIHPLRERLAAREKALYGEVDIDDAMEVFADWLRQEAGRHWAMGNMVEDSQERYLARFLMNLADAIYPKETHDGQ